MLALVLSAGSAAAYTEIVATRMPYAGSTSPAPSSWPRFPSADASQVVATSAGALALAPGADKHSLGVYFASEKAPTFKPLGLDRPPAWDGGGARLATRGGSAIALATAACVYRLSCVLGGDAAGACALSDGVPAAACAPGAPAAAGAPLFGAVHAAAAGNASLWLATRAGLFRLPRRGGARARPPGPTAISK